MASTFWNYLSLEILGNVGKIDGRPQSPDNSIGNFIKVAFELERFVFLGFLIALDTFLYLFTYFPIRLVIAAFSFLNYLQQMIFQFLSQSFYLKTEGRSKFNQVRAFDLIRFGMMVVSFIILYYFNLSQVYHRIRSQNTIKLYVLASMIEVLDKLLATFGQDAFTALHESLHQTNFPVAQIVITLIYVIIHSILYFFQVATLTVVVNSTDDALLTVLIVNNFTELKAFVFKKYDPNNLFQLSCSDIVETFQMLLFLTLVFMVTLTQNGFNWLEQGNSFLTVTLMIVFAEILADCAKHSFICKFNSIDSQVYQSYSIILRQDILSHSKEDVIVDHTWTLTRRLGLCQVNVFQPIFKSLNSILCSCLLVLFSFDIVLSFIPLSPSKITFNAMAIFRFAPIYF